MLRTLLPDEPDDQTEVARLIDRGRAVPSAVTEPVCAVVVEVLAGVERPGAPARAVALRLRPEGRRER